MSTATSPGAIGRLKAAADTRPLAVVWLATVIFSTGPVMVATMSNDGVVIAFWRMWAGVPVLGLLATFQIRASGRRPTRRGWRLAAVAGIVFALHQIALMESLRRTTVVDVTLMNTLAPVVVAVLAVPMFGERPGVQFRLWSLVAMAGAAAVAVVGSSGPGGQPLGMSLAAANVVAYSAYFVMSKQARQDIDTWPFLFGALGTATLLVTAFGLTIHAPVADISLHDLALCIAIAVLPGAVGHGAMTWALRYVPANIPPVIMLLIPLLAGVLAWLIAGQTVKLVTIAGGIITVAGVLGAVRSPAAQSLSAVESLDLAEST
ncbi:MAG: DMT family transporter [Acidimicrobiales bacterium]|nr:DMT family transporter [Acidimicrobiales bacterium]